MELHTAVTVLGNAQAHNDLARRAEAAEAVQSALQRLARSRAGTDTHVQEDLVSQVLQRILTRGGPTQPLTTPGRARGWLARVLKSKFIDHLRKKKRRQTHAFSDASAPEEQEPNRRLYPGEGAPGDGIFEAPEQLLAQVVADLRSVAEVCDASPGRRAPIAQTVEDLIALYIEKSSSADDLVAREVGEGATGSEGQIRNRLERRQNRARAALLDTVIAQRGLREEMGLACPNCGLGVGDESCAFCADPEDLPAAEGDDLYADPERVQRLMQVIEHLKHNW